MKVAVIGSGAREHAIAWSLRRHRAEGDVFVLPGNAGIPGSVPVRADDLEGIVRFCAGEGVGLVVVGPEAPLAAGLVDRLRAAGLAALGPTRSAARLETSKLYSKRFMQKHAVPTAEGWLFEAGQDPGPVIDALEGRLVLKYDGLAAGKGVWVCGSLESARTAVAELRRRHGPDARFLIERRLEGDELSLIGLTDGASIRLLPPSQDHKALRDGDEGPNTGGMGAFSPVPGLEEGALAQIRREIVEPTLRGIRAEGLDYRGFLYFGLMLTAEGPRLLEYNVRLGDPEAEAILPLLETDLAALALAAIDGTLGRAELRVAPGAAASVVLAARGYPEDPESGRAISGLERLDAATLVFHGGVRREGERLVTSGGRVMNLVRREADLEAALRRVYEEVEKVGFDGAQYRRDIGRRPWKLARHASRS